MNFIDQYRNNIQNINILIIGDVMIDAYLWGKVDRISPEAPVPVVAVNKRENRLGGAANVALNVLSLGARPILMGVLGNDSKGHEFISIMEKHGLSPEAMILSEERITTTKFRILGNNTQMLRVDEEHTHPLSPELKEKFFARFESIINSGKIDAIVFEDYDKGLIDPEMIRFVTSLAVKNNIPVCVDPKKRNFHHFEACSLFKPNLKEFLEGTNISLPEKTEDLAGFMHDFRDKYNIQMLMLTMAEKGVLLSYTENKENKHTLIPAKIRNVADVSGAGDTVISVAAVCLAMQFPPRVMAELSNLAGGIVCEYVGVVPIDPARLIEEADKSNSL